MGKTTVSRRTAGYLTYRGLAVGEPVRRLSDRSALVPSLRGWLGKLGLIARELLTHPVHSLRALAAIAGTGQPSLPVLAMVSANWLVQCALLHGRSAGAVVRIAEEGIFQALWTIALEARPGTVGRIARTLTAALPLPQVVAFVEADPRLVLRRLEQRNGRASRADRWGRERGDALTHAHTLMLEVVGALREADGPGGRPRLIHVDNFSVRDPEFAARRLALKIEQLIHDGAGAEPVPADGVTHAPAVALRPRRAHPHGAPADAPASPVRMSVGMQRTER